MNILELFSGTGSIRKAAIELGCNVYSSDILNDSHIDYSCDILDFDIANIPFNIDMIWASPPCTWFSIENFFRHFKIIKYRSKKRYIPITDEAHKAIEYVSKTIDIIEIIKPKYFFIENPRDILRHLPVMNRLSKFNFHRHTVSYFDYGYNYWKPTDLFHNNENFKPIPMIKKHNLKNHTTCEKNHNTKKLNSIPIELCKAVILSCLE